MRFAGKDRRSVRDGRHRGVQGRRPHEQAASERRGGARAHDRVRRTVHFAHDVRDALGSRAVVDTFDRSFPWEVEHISLAKAADVFVIAPATANVIAKAAHGIADDMVTTTLLATRAPVVVAPAMNTGMYDNPVTQSNLETLRGRGFHIIDPAAGHLACGDSGRGKLPDTQTLLWGIEKALTGQDLAGKHVLVTAGPTQEAMDPVRFLSNHSTGKMGYAIAGRAAMRGAEVTLVSGPTALDTPKGVNRVDIRSARDMYDAVLSRAAQQDFIIKAAAVGDYRPCGDSGRKAQKGDGELNIRLARNPDILAALGADKRPGQLLCGFAMETQNLLDNAESKLRRKNCDMLVANSLRDKGCRLRHGHQHRNAPVRGRTPGTAVHYEQGRPRGPHPRPSARHEPEITDCKGGVTGSAFCGINHYKQQERP